MNIADYKNLSPFEMELLERFDKLKIEINYITAIAKRLEKELPDED